MIINVVEKVACIYTGALTGKGALYCGVVGERGVIQRCWQGKVRYIGVWQGEGAFYRGLTEVWVFYRRVNRERGALYGGGDIDRGCCIIRSLLGCPHRKGVRWRK